MKCIITAKNEEIFKAVVLELSDFGKTYTVMPLGKKVDVLWAKKEAVEGFLEARRINLNNLLVEEV